MLKIIWLQVFGKQYIHMVPKYYLGTYLVIIKGKLHLLCKLLGTPLNQVVKRMPKNEETWYRFYGWMDDVYITCMFKLKINHVSRPNVQFTRIQEIEKTIRQVQIVRYSIRQLCPDSSKVSIMKKRKVEVPF